MKIKIYEPDKLVPPFEMLDAVSAVSGTEKVTLLRCPSRAPAEPTLRMPMAIR